MDIRARRRCVECGRRWSYFETRSTTCPDCGSHRSVSAQAEATLDTDGRAALDLTPARSKVDDQSVREVADHAAAIAREYLRGRGFVREGTLLDLDDTYLAAAELAHTGDHVRRAARPDASAEAHLLSLLAGAETGERPVEVPEPMRWARGLASADAVAAYRLDVCRWARDRSDHSRTPPLDRLRAHERRIKALDGDVPAAEAASLVAAARCVGRFLGGADEDAADAAASALARLDERVQVD